MSGLPESVLRGAQEADRLQQSLANGAGAAHMDPDAIPGAVAAPGTPTAAPLAPAPTNGAGASHGETVEQVNRRLSGFRSYHDGKMAEHKQALRQRDDENAQLKAELERVKSQQRSAPADPFALSEEERYSLGDEGVNVINRVTATNQQAIDETRTEIARLREERQQEEQRRHQQFLSGLATLVPNYQQINGHPNFLAWLAQIDPDTGAERQRSLDFAIEAGDYQAASHVFNQYLLLATNAPANGMPSAADPALQSVLPATPRTPSGSPDDGVTHVEIWSRSEVDDFYREMQRYMTRSGGKNPDRVKEYQETEQRIVQALQEGRVEP